jgi:hypothetical protein
MDTFVVLVIAVTAIILASIAGRAAAKKSRSGRGVAVGKAQPPDAESEASPELVAVLAAAVSAASGMAPESFRIVGFEPSRGSPPQCGFNTPVWGHIDRSSRGE